MNALRRHGLDLAVPILLAAGALAAGTLLTRTRIDPDLHFHLAMSRLTAEQGVVRSLPQVTGLSWSRQFPEKEFLFHQLTALGYRAAGDAGAKEAAALMTVAAMLALYALCRRYRSPLEAGALVLVAVLLNGYFLFRVELMRPHVLATFCAELLVWGLLARNRWLSAASAAAFALSYHTLYIPAGLLGAAAVVASVRRDRAVGLAIASGAAGLIAGVLINPYFPLNVIATAVSTRIALSAHGAASLGVAYELMPLPPGAFARWFGGALLLVGLGAAALVKDARMRCEMDAPFLGLSTVGLWVLAWVNPRATEYAIPLTCVLAAAALPRSLPRFGIILAAVAAWNVASLPGLDRWGIDERFLASTEVAVRHLPAEAAGKKVFNCSFELGSILLHLRPDVGFVDLSDPQLLAWQDPVAARAREAFRSGAVVDPRALVHDAFGADYVLCGQPAAVQLLDADPRFLRLWPVPPSPAGPEEGPGLYRVLPDVDALARADMDWTAPASADALRALRPPNGVPARVIPLGTNVNLRALDPADGASGPRCAWLRVPASEAARHAGAEFLAVGGDPLIRLWWNDSPLFEGGPFSTPRLFRALVSLPHPLAASDRIALLACAPRSVSWNASMSFWTRASVDDTCAAKARPRPDPGGWQDGAETCLGPIFAPGAARPR